MPEAYIIDALRTPTGKRKGSLSQMHPADLAGSVLSALVSRQPIPAHEYDDVVFGCVDTIGPLAGDIARTAWLAAGLPLEVPGTTVDRQCGSSQQALHFAAQAVMSGTMDVVMVGGVQTMTAIPISSAMLAGQPLGFPDPFSGSKGWKARFGDQPVNQFYAAQRIADHWGCDRAAMESFSLASHVRALKAIEEGAFSREVLPLPELAMDETPRQTSLEKMATLEPVLPEYPSITAGVSSQTCDAAAGLIVASEQAVKRYGLKPRARIVHMSVMGDCPIWHLRAPIPATQRALERTGLSMADIDLAEVNEAFASVVMAWMKELDYPHERTNVRGGAIALGHPLGASGVKLMTTLLHALEDRGGRLGLQTMCEGGGQANVTIIERVS
ncbi:MAG: acetyl-CoA C-acetyltransferase [Burkholderiaceae bacterium]